MPLQHIVTVTILKVRIANSWITMSTLTKFLFLTHTHTHTSGHQLNMLYLLNKMLYRL